MAETPRFDTGQESLRMNAGLRKAAAGIVVLTPAYLAGRF